ncbi:precorrin-2 dehydrogenase/sirohydrochlorin ferrochelatase family protein [Vibrio gallicus]|uniref:precorrin-2 dehydrogenase/sirohydrochlorin ferrochelatase family protein n=1 Tax=Vibrio gallicus TaxID=190897 RepID=UPI0021C37FF1|nr:siroheme synthase [Vibrio gallicus]
MQYFPLFYDLNHKPVLVVGGGEVACRKVEALIKAGALVTVVSPRLDPYLADQYHQQAIIWIKSFYRSELIDDFIQVWATTDNPQLNHRVHHDAKRAGIMVNVVDDTPYCDFITPSMIERGKVQIAFSSGGASPVLIRNLRKLFEAVLPQNLALHADFASSKREDIKQYLSDVRKRRLFWEAFFSSAAVLKAQHYSELETAYHALLASQRFEPSFKVFWVETGDDFELLSLKALRLMQNAEMVFVHKDIQPVFIEGVRRDAERDTWTSMVELKPMLEVQKHKSTNVVILLPRLNSMLEAEIELGFDNVELLRSL